jgi:hypothetical protein
MNQLTRRQRDVLTKLQDLYREKGHPIHYTVLAQRLGINRFSAYDMLKVLERKGAVGSQYVLSKVTGPGRPAVAFYPLAQAARQALSRLGDGLEWSQVKERLLSLVGQAANGDNTLLNDLLDTIPQSSDSLVYCGRVLAALVLSLGQRAHSYGRSLLAAANSAEGLDLFASLALGLSLTGSQGQQLGDRLVDYSQRCQQYIAEMDAARRDDLANFVRQIVVIRSS